MLKTHLTLFLILISRYQLSLNDFLLQELFPILLTHSSQASELVENH